ncbi:MAG TPA: hypothetical protein PKD54_06745, partial [Pirellulaceae bacterium]|nr:hypothetical protein [Pirellulaceae bacterium]
AWNDSYTVAIDSDGVITETITGSGYDHTDIVLDRLKTDSTSLFHTGNASSMSVLIQWDIDEGLDGRGSMTYGGDPGSGGGGGSGSGGSSGTGGGGEPGASGSGEGHLRLGSSSRFGELGSGWIHTTYVTNLLLTHTPLPEEENSGEGGSGSGGGSGGGGDGSGSTSGNPNASIVPRFDSLLTGTVQTNTTSSYTSAIDDAFAQLFGESSGQGESGAMNYDFYNLFELSLDELLSESAASSSIDREVTFNSDHSVDVTFNGTRTRNRSWSSKYTIPVNNRWLDESGYYHQEQGKLRFEGTYQSQMSRTLDDLNIRFLPAPPDDPETEEDESEIVPDPIVSGEIVTTITNQKHEKLWTLEDMVHQRFRVIAPDENASPGTDSTLFSQSYKKDVARGRLADWGHLRTTLTQSFEENAVRQVDLAVEYLGQGNRSEWELFYEGFGWDYSVGFDPDPSSGGGMYDVREQYHEYLTCNVGQSLVTGGGTLTFRRVPATGENPPDPYELQTSGAWVVTTQANGDSTADGFGYALHRTFSAPQYITDSMSTGVLLGFGSNGQPLENPGGGLSYYDKLNFAEYVHNTEDHFDGTLIETLSYSVEPDPDDATQQRFAKQYTRDVNNHVWGAKDNTEHRFGYERQYSGGGYTDLTPSYETWLVEQNQYDSTTDPLPEAWLYHPDGYLSPLFRGFVIDPTADPMNLTSGSFAEQYDRLPRGPFNSYARTGQQDGQDDPTGGTGQKINLNLWRFEDGDTIGVVQIPQVLQGWLELDADPFDDGNSTKVRVWHIGGYEHYIRRFKERGGKYYEYQIHNRNPHFLFGLIPIGSDLELLHRERFYIEDGQEEVTLELIRMRAIQMNLSTAAMQTELNLHVAGVAGIVIVGILVPGPEEVVIAAAATKGIRLIYHAGLKQWRAYRKTGGQELTGEALEQTIKEIAEEVAKREAGAPRWTAPAVKKAVNSDIIHASEQAVARGVFPDTKSAAEALRALSKKFKTEGLPAGTIPDPKRADSVLVPFGNGWAVYEIMPNGTAILRTVLGSGT